MNLKNTAQKIIIQATDWSRRKNRIVIGIDGYSGVGKTTLLHTIKTLSDDIACIHLDDFILTGSYREKLIEESHDPSKIFELKWYAYDKVRVLVSSFKEGRKKNYQLSVYNPKTDAYDVQKNIDVSKNILMIEGVFLFHPQTLDDLWDYRVYIDADISEADIQRVKREKKRWGSEHISEDDPKSFTQLFKIAFKRYQRENDLVGKSDLVIQA